MEAKAAGRIFYKFLTKKLAEIGFRQSETDECVFYKGTSIYVLYTDDSILTGPNPRELDQIVHDLKHKAKLDLTCDADMGDFLGVKIDRQEDGSINLTQPQLIDQILKDLRLDGKDVKTKATPLPTNKVIHKFEGSEPFDGHFDFRRAIGKLLYLDKSTRSDISYATHVLARHTLDPKKEHGEMVKWLGRYLLHTRDKGTILRPTDEGFDCFVDASFAGDWDKDAVNDHDNFFAKSRSGYVIRYAGCPIIWASKLQTVVSLSSTESEVIALSMATREIIPLLRLARELKTAGFPINSDEAKIRCKIFEDNNGCIAIATKPKVRPRTKHLCTQWFHFQQHVSSGDLKMVKVDTEDQASDHLTKAIGRQLLKKHRLTIQGWDDHHEVDDKANPDDMDLDEDGCQSERECEILGIGAARKPNKRKRNS